MRGLFFVSSSRMHLLYLDESGTVGDPTHRYFVLAGVAVFERKTHWVEQMLNDVAKRFNPADPYSIELHGSPMRSGRGVWHRLPLAARVGAIRDALNVGVCEHKNDGVVLFGAVIKKASLSGADPVERAFEEISNRFDLFLRRLYVKHRDPQRGIILFDKSSVEARIQSLARSFKYSGHRWGSSRNYADVPVFMDSRASRLIQLADLVAFALFRFYEKGDNTFYDVIKHCFDTDGGVEHGLYVHL